MSKFLKEHGGEVMNMLTAEFDIDKYGEARERKGERRGEQRGREKEKERMTLELIKKNIPMQYIIEMTGWSIEKIEEFKEKNKL